MTDPVTANLGAIYTKSWIADFMLDLAGYTAEVDLGAGTILEPSCGNGAFVVPMALRLITSARSHNRAFADLHEAILAYDIDPTAVARTRNAVSVALVRAGVYEATARSLADHWVRIGDFLNDVTATGAVQWAVGNPPYVRTEQVPAEIMESYRAHWPTMRGRADIYVGFFEAALRHLAPGGSLVFICADRWMKNQYGAGLRELIQASYALDLVLDLHDVDVFVETVAAYPAITVIHAATPGETVFARAAESFDASAAADLVQARMSDSWPPHSSFEANVIALADSGLSWAIGGADDLTLIADLEQRFPTIADTGVTINVGIATGADTEFIVRTGADIEPERLLKLVGPSDISSGVVEWGGRWLINTFDGDVIAPLAENPRMAAYLHAREERLKARYVAKKSPDSWWRTIDRPNVAAYAEPKLLLADIKDNIEPVLDLDGFAPMHSLYYLRSATWDLRALGGLLLSDIAGTFLTAYSVRMASGRMRVSSQYLKRLRLPSPDSLSYRLRGELAAAFVARDRTAASLAAKEAYGLSVAGDIDAT